MPEGPRVSHQAPRAAFQSQPLPEFPLGPDCAHHHERTKGVIPEGPLSSTGIQIPAVTSLRDLLPAMRAGQTLGVRWERVIKGLMYCPPETPYQQGQLLFQEGNLWRLLQASDISLRWQLLKSKPRWKKSILTRRKLFPDFKD